MFSKDKLSSQGLLNDNIVDSHALVVAPQIEENLEQLDISNFKKEENITSFVFFGGADISICFLLWLVSAVLLVLIYLKFVAGKKFSNSHFFSNLKRKTSTNPLLGKVWNMKSNYTFYLCLFVNVGSYLIMFQMSSN